MAKLKWENILTRLEQREYPLNSTCKFEKLDEAYTYTEIRKLLEKNHKKK